MRASREAASAGMTRFAPAPTGYLHLGHVVNALYVWGLARATGREVLLRIEDHDRQRSRRAFDEAIGEDLAWLGFVPDAGPVRQSEDGHVYAAALETLRFNGRVYACDCTRATFAGWARDHGAAWFGEGCPGDCRARGLEERAGTTLRVAVGGGEETFHDRRLGPRRGMPAAGGDVVVRDRHGNWTYHFCVVVDDARQGIDLVVRGEDLLEATAVQIRLARLLGRVEPPAFYHHGLVLRPDGSKLSKSAGDSGVRELRAAGRSPAEVIGEAAAAVGLFGADRPVSAGEAVDQLAADLRRSLGRG